ncbi:hypothetical protein SORBI_3008G120066 [Sorghum bicolor]|uniref:Uncharacterized protein n=1 Tax=Sorghum bicolor TaxID=4558 RepID=A0A1Z5R6Q7_SORBI|nr:hypothetical protein SORBI_3008G120066 [Sorghum bicolor]
MHLIYDSVRLVFSARSKCFCLRSEFRQGLAAASAVLIFVCRQIQSTFLLTKYPLPGSCFFFLKKKKTLSGSCW